MDTINFYPIIVKTSGHKHEVMKPPTGVIKKAYAEFINSIPKKDKKRLTVVGVFSPDGKSITFGIAKLNYKDNFNKAFGREIAQSRAEKGKGKTYILNTPGSRKEAVTKGYEYVDEIKDILHTLHVGKNKKKTTNVSL